MPSPSMAQSLSLALVVILSIGSACGTARKKTVAANADQEINRCLKLSSKKKYQQAVECLEVFKSRYPSGSKAAEADLMIADNHYRQKEYILAAEAYQEYVRRHSFHAKVDYAYYKSGLSYMNELPTVISRDQQYLDLAVKNFEMVHRHFPDSPYSKISGEKYGKARSRQAKRHYTIARFYYKYGEYLASIPRFLEVVVDFPGLGYDEKSFYYLILAYLKTNQLDLAEGVLSTFNERFPQSSLMKRARSRRTRQGSTREAS